MWSYRKESAVYDIVVIVKLLFRNLIVDDIWAGVMPSILIVALKPLHPYLSTDINDISAGETGSTLTHTLGSAELQIKSD